MNLGIQHLTHELLGDTFKAEIHPSHTLTHPDFHIENRGQSWAFLEMCIVSEFLVKKAHGR
jgi:hypothetical protein